MYMISIMASILEKNNWNEYGFKLENVKKIPHIHIKGQLGLWNYDYKNNQ